MWEPGEQTPGFSESCSILLVLAAETLNQILHYSLQNQGLLEQIPTLVGRPEACTFAWFFFLSVFLYLILMAPEGPYTEPDPPRKT